MSGARRRLPIDAPSILEMSADGVASNGYVGPMLPDRTGSNARVASHPPAPPHASSATTPRTCRMEKRAAIAAP